MLAPLLVNDLSGRVVTANPAYCSLVRRSAEDLPGAPSMEFVHPGDWFSVVADVLM